MFSSPDKFVLHYLPYSRAQRIAWLLQELNLDYELKVYPRNKQRMAPKELIDIWPTGMSPILQIFKEGQKPKTLAESGHIINYVIQNYDTTGKLTPDTQEDKDMVDYYLHFAEGSIQPHLVSMMVGDMAGNSIPWPINCVIKPVLARISSAFYAKRAETNFRFLDTQLEKKGGGYLVGDRLSGADFIMDFPVNDCLFASRSYVNAITSGNDVDQEFPNLYRWHELIMNEPLRLKALEAAKSKL